MTARSDVRLACPTLVPYSRAFQAQAARELPEAGPAVQRLVNDYSALRDACRKL